MLFAGGQRGGAGPPVRVAAPKWGSPVPMAYTVGNRESTGPVLRRMLAGG